jgi:hypothetical protein
MITIRRVGIGSAFKVSAVLTALFWAIFGLLFLLFPTLLVGQLTTGSTSGFSSSQDFADVAGGSLILVYFCGIAIYAVIGGLIGALYAFLYNLVAGWVGGLEVELSSAPSASVTVNNPSWGSTDLSGRGF